MSPSIAHPTLSTFVRSWMVGIMLSAITYGVGLTLACSCISLLQRSSDATGQQKRRVLTIYILFMLAISTFCVISDIYTFVIAFPDPHTPVAVLETIRTVTLVLSNWGADGFLVCGP